MHIGKARESDLLPFSRGELSARPERDLPHVHIGDYVCLKPGVRRPYCEGAVEGLWTVGGNVLHPAEIQVAIQQGPVRDVLMLKEVHVLEHDAHASALYEQGLLVHLRDAVRVADADHPRNREIGDVLQIIRKPEGVRYLIETRRGRYAEQDTELEFELHVQDAVERTVRHGDFGRLRDRVMLDYEKAGIYDPSQIEEAARGLVRREAIEELRTDEKYLARRQEARELKFVELDRDRFTLHRRFPPNLLYRPRQRRPQRRI